MDGIYDRPPEEPGAQLIAQLQVGGPVERGGSMSPVVTAYTQQGSLVQSLETSAAAHDTTGGVATKVEEAAAAARAGAIVRISRAGTRHAMAACLPGPLPPDWVGTVVSCGISASG